MVTPGGGGGELGSRGVGTGVAYPPVMVAGGGVGTSPGPVLLLRVVGMSHLIFLQHSGSLGSSTKWQPLGT